MTAKITDVSTIAQAGFDPKTGLPARLDASPLCDLLGTVKKILRVKDEQDAINRFEWGGLPKGLTGNLIERILYYKGQAALFHIATNDCYYFLPYSLDGSIDVYGRFQSVTPLPFMGGTDKGGKPRPWIQGLSRRPVYDLEDEGMDPEKDCVILWDYSNQMSQVNISRQILNDGIIQAEAEAFPLARTACVANSGVKGIRVPDEDAAEAVKLASRSITRAALSGDPWTAITSSMEFQELTSSSSPTSQEFLQYMQALDNFRLSTHGIKTGGVFEKSAHILQDEQNMNAQATASALEDAIRQRQAFCDLANKLFGLSLTVSARSEESSPAPGEEDEGREDAGKEYNEYDDDQGV